MTLNVASDEAKKKGQRPPHPYLAGNFAPVTKTHSPTPVSWTGHLPGELHGGMYVRNGGNPVANSDLGREAHWFDGDGMLSGVWFERPSPATAQPNVKFVNQFILTDVFLSNVEHPSLRTPVLPSIATLVNPASTLLHILWRILRSILIVLLSHLPGSKQAVTRISVANTSILWHDGRALATCESGPPIRVMLPGLETVGWYDGSTAEGEPRPALQDPKYLERESHLGGDGLLSWMREWTTGHPKRDESTKELILFHCSFVAPYVFYSVLPERNCSTNELDRPRIVNVAVPGCSGGKLMHDFGASRHHTVILDLPLSLTPFNLVKSKPVVCYEPEKPARFGVFPRQRPDMVRWFETRGCCVFHTANTWDEFDSDGNPVAVNMLVCRLTSASLVFSAGNIEPPPRLKQLEPIEDRPMSFFASYDEDEFVDPEKVEIDETTPLLTPDTPHTIDTHHPPEPFSEIPVSHDEQEECRLYYYRFALDSSRNAITHQFALSAIPFEFPTVSPRTSMDNARFIYGCSTSYESFGAALGKATKIDVIVRMDIHTLVARARKERPTTVTGCVDHRSIEEILLSVDANEPIKAFQLPPNHFAQEATFVPRQSNSTLTEEDGYLLFYVFNEDQLDHSGLCKEDATSELWVLDAKNMKDVVCKVRLPTRVPYGLHGNWFTEEQIRHQRDIEVLRKAPVDHEEKRWAKAMGAILG